MVKEVWDFKTNSWQMCCYLFRMQWCDIDLDLHLGHLGDFQIFLGLHEENRGLYIY